MPAPTPRRRIRYEKYNAVLRFFAVKNKDGSVQIEYASEAGVPFLQKKCGLLNLGTWKPVEGGVRWQWDNMYTTTIHAINSVVVKMSRLSKIKPLYRGWTDATLPKSFFEADGMGVKGGVEYGFSSTTTDRAQAAHYAQGKASTILELEMGMVDRGADIGARLPASALAPDTRFLPSCTRLPSHPAQTGSRSTRTRRRRCCRR